MSLHTECFSLCASNGETDEERTGDHSVEYEIVFGEAKKVNEAVILWRCLSLDCCLVTETNSASRDVVGCQGSANHLTAEHP